MGEEPGRRRRRVRPTHPAPSTTAPPPDPAPDPSDAAVTVAEGVVAETSAVLDPDDGRVDGPKPVPDDGPKPVPEPDDGPKPSAMRPGPAGGRAPRPSGPAPGARPAAPAPAAAGPGPRPAGRDEPAERGLRGLVGSGSSQVSVAAAMRARDAARPSEQQLADAEQNLSIVRRNWVPREDLPRGR